MKTLTPAKITSADENTYRIYIRGSSKGPSSVETYESDATGDDGRERA